MPREALNWLSWQMGSAPFVSGGFGHFYAYAPMHIQYAVDRYAMEFPVRGVAPRGGFLLSGVSKNSINPHFWIEADGLRMWILKTWRLAFGDLKQVDARKTMGGVALIFHSAAEHRVFIVRFADAALARSAFARVVSSAPLTEEAAILRDGDARGATRGLSRYDGPLG